jgi:hypothetical protein
MTFANLIVGDHFIWPLDRVVSVPDSVNVNIKIASGEGGGGFAVDLATREDCIYQDRSKPGPLEQWIPGDAPVIKLNGAM